MGYEGTTPPAHTYFSPSKMNGALVGMIFPSAHSNPLCQIGNNYVHLVYSWKIFYQLVTIVFAIVFILNIPCFGNVNSDTNKPEIHVGVFNLPLFSMIKYLYENLISFLIYIRARPVTLTTSNAI